MDIVAFCRKPGIIIVKSQYKEILSLPKSNTQMKQTWYRYKT